MKVVIPVLKVFLFSLSFSYQEYKLVLYVIFNVASNVNIILHLYLGLVQFSSVTQSCPTLGDPMNCSMPGFPAAAAATAAMSL